jgi:hypothetical protein
MSLEAPERCRQLAVVEARREELLQSIQTKQGGEGTGARGAPVPKVGIEQKFKHAESRTPGSSPNEGRVNSR